MNRKDILLLEEQIRMLGKDRDKKVDEVVNKIASDDFLIEEEFNDKHKEYNFHLIKGLNSENKIHGDGYNKERWKALTEAIVVILNKVA